MPIIAIFQYWRWRYQFESHFYRYPSKYYSEQRLWNQYFSLLDELIRPSYFFPKKSETDLILPKKAFPFLLVDSYDEFCFTCHCIMQMSLKNALHSIVGFLRKFQFPSPSALVRFDVKRDKYSWFLKSWLSPNLVTVESNFYCWRCRFYPEERLSIRYHFA